MGLPPALAEGHVCLTWAAVAGSGGGREVAGAAGLAGGIACSSCGRRARQFRPLTLDLPDAST